MALRQTPPTIVLILLCGAVFPSVLAVLMLGPLLVALAHEFRTSVAVVGQLAGGYLGGGVAASRRRLACFALACLGSGLLAALVFTAWVPPWAAAALACGAAGLSRVSMVVTPLVVLDRAGGSRTTATGLFAVSNQLGALGGASLGGLMLALGGFPLVGHFCLGVAIVAAGLIHLTVRESATFLAQTALRPDPTATD